MRRRSLIASGLAVASPWPAAAATAHPPPSDTKLKTLRLAFSAAETAFDPPQTESDGNTRIILSQILESPLGYDYLARPVRRVPRTASALPEISADGQTITLRIRPGIFFSDDPAFKGRRRELTAQDYVYSLKRFYDPRWKSSDLYVFEPMDLPGMAALRDRSVKGGKPFDYDTDVDGVRALDRYTLRVRLGRPDPRFVDNFADPGLLGAVAREVVEFHGDDIGAHPVGTGPFRLANWRRRSSIELERSPSWRGEVYEGQPADDPIARQIAAQLMGQALPRVDRVVVDIIEEAQPMWLSFLRGQLDRIEAPAAFRTLAAPGGRLAPFLAKKGVRLQAQLRADMAFTYFFMDHPVVGGYTPDKVALRRAIGLALDGETYLRTVFGGFGQRAQSTLPPFTSGYESDYRSEMSEYNPARAKSLLDLYGYVDRNGDGWREQPDGSPLVLKLSCTGSQLDRSANEVWKRSLDAVGVRIEFDISNWSELLKMSRAGGLMMWGYRWAAVSPDGSLFLNIAYGPAAGDANDARFSLPAFDRLFERQRALPDGAEREAVIRKAKNLLVAYMPFKVHAHTVMLDLVQPWTQGFWRHPFMNDTWRFIDVAPAEIE
jgi:ABC-type transport system substrate-binding protein